LGGSGFLPRNATLGAMSREREDGEGKSTLKTPAIATTTRSRVMLRNEAKEIGKVQHSTRMAIVVKMVVEWRDGRMWRVGRETQKGD
jgi:hypothetical protein